jgi:hypothetical protein
MRRWILIATVDDHLFGSFGPYIPHSKENAHDHKIRRLIVRRISKPQRKMRWQIWGVPE